jgi:hypothetical protein
MELQKAMEERLDDLVGEFGVMEGFDRWELEVERLLAVIRIQRLVYYVWRNFGKEGKG